MNFAATHTSCPTCGARPNQPCRILDGPNIRRLFGRRPIPFTHTARGPAR